MSETYPSQPPDNYSDPDPHELLLEARRQARAHLPNLPTSVLNALLDLLCPEAKKLRWYEARYNAMLAENQRLMAESKKLYEKNRQLEDCQR